MRGRELISSVRRGGGESSNDSILQLKRALRSRSDVESCKQSECTLHLSVLPIKGKSRKLKKNSCPTFNATRRRQIQRDLAIIGKRGEIHF